MREYEGSFTLKGDINKICDLAETYFPNQGFSLESSQKPNRLVFKKKGTSWTRDVRKIPHTLYVTIVNDDMGAITIVMTYVFHTAGFLTSSGERNLDSDITAFRDAILAKSPQFATIRCPSCGHENPENANYCNNCGGKLDYTRTYQ